jgi:hypothetical protein
MVLILLKKTKILLIWNLYANYFTILYPSNNPVFILNRIKIEYIIYLF